MSYMGDFAAGATVRMRFNTVNTSGVPTTLTSGAVTISKDGSDVTPSGGVTLTADVGSVTGRHHVVIVTATDATTFTAGSEYAVRLSGSSAVGGVSVVGIVVGEFSIQNRYVLPAASIASAVLTTAMTESYNADGAAPTLTQAMFVSMQRLTEFATSGTAITVKKLDGSTTAYGLTMDNATTPTSSTRSS